VNGPERPRSSSRLLAQIGFAASAFAVFLCGWLGMRTDDWRKMVAYAALALVAAALASAFSRRR
jgi:NADH:ubiquinone oxidoreductase subunit 4 (subunit M)